jgi:membrane-associated protease RseP (regulator of RpoE activity)
VSSNLPEFTSASEQWDVSPGTEPPPTQREWIISILLLLATIATTSFAGMCYRLPYDLSTTLLIAMHKPSTLLYGFPFSIPLIIILLAHELGHFLACRYYGMSCTPPFFIPLPLPIVGTLGAFIRIKSKFLNRKALFDIGIAGPLAGFVFLLPALWMGISLSALRPKGLIPHGTILFGEPILFRFFGRFILGYSPSNHDMDVGLITIAALVGLLATSLNLLPIWQLDGGHISYAIWGRSSHRKLSIFALGGLIAVSLLEWRWPLPPFFLFIVLLLIFGIRSRFYHPSVLVEEESLGAGRVILGLIAYLILVLSFTPLPVSIS